MALYDRNGGRLPTSLFEAAAWHHRVVAICRRCAHEAVFDPHALWWLYHRKGWDSSLRGAGRRMKCAKCGAGAFVTWSRDKPVTRDLPFPDEREWKRALSRFRS